MKRDEYRKGKWTPEEERYTAKLIDMFNAGLLPPAESFGKTLRVYLAEKLNCDPMRITKKFTGKLSLGKKLYSEAPPSSENEQTEEMRKELQALEEAFLKKVEETQCRPRGRQLPELDVSSILQAPVSNIYMTNDFYKPNVYNFLPMKPAVFPAAAYYYGNSMENQSPRYFEPEQNSPRYPQNYPQGSFNVPNFNPTVYPNPYMNMSAYPYAFPFHPGIAPQAQGAASRTVPSQSTPMQHMSSPFPYYMPHGSRPSEPTLSSSSAASAMPPNQCLNSAEESDAAIMLLGLMQRQTPGQQQAPYTNGRVDAKEDTEHPAIDVTSSSSVAAVTNPISDTTFTNVADVILPTRDAQSTGVAAVTSPTSDTISANVADDILPRDAQSTGVADVTCPTSDTTSTNVADVIHPTRDAQSTGVADATSPTSDLLAVIGESLLPDDEPTESQPVVHARPTSTSTATTSTTCNSTCTTASSAVSVSNGDDISPRTPIDLLEDSSSAPSPKKQRVESPL